jgi:type IV pilus assembly protein PilE
VKRLDDARGLTLIELMIALMIIGILAAIAIPDYFSRVDRAREAGTKSNMHTLQLASEDYAVENGGIYSAVIDASHIGNRLPAAFENPFSHTGGAGVAWEDRASMSAAPSAIPGLTSYADSDTVVYNIKGAGRGGAFNLVLTTGR